MIQFSRSMQPLLIGSVVLLSLACRQDDHSIPTETSPGQSARNIQTEMPPSAGPEERPSSTDLNRPKSNPDDMSLEERMPVAGHDDTIDLSSGGAGGKSGMGGSGGAHH